MTAAALHPSPSAKIPSNTDPSTSLTCLQGATTTVGNSCPAAGGHADTPGARDNLAHVSNQCQLPALFCCRFPRSSQGLHQAQSWAPPGPQSSLPTKAAACAVCREHKRRLQDSERRPCFPQPLRKLWGKERDKKACLCAQGAEDTSPASGQGQVLPRTGVQPRRPCSQSRSSDDQWGKHQDLTRLQEQEAPTSRGATAKSLSHSSIRAEQGRGAW